jgi:hypothetical protein
MDAQKTLPPMSPSMLCLSFLRTSLPCPTTLDGLRTTCRRKFCVAFKNSKSTYRAHHEAYKELIAGRLYDDAVVHRQQCMDIYISDAHIAHLERRLAQQASIYQEQLQQRIREQKAQEDLDQATSLVGNLQGMNLHELQATQFTLQYGAGADVGEDLLDPDDEL